MRVRILSNLILTWILVQRRTIVYDRMKTVDTYTNSGGLNFWNGSNYEVTHSTKRVVTYLVSTVSKGDSNQPYDGFEPYTNHVRRLGRWKIRF